MVGTSSAACGSTTKGHRSSILSSDLRCARCASVESAPTSGWSCMSDLLQIPATAEPDVKASDAKYGSSVCRRIAYLDLLRVMAAEAKASDDKAFEELASNSCQHACRLFQQQLLA